MIRTVVLIGFAMLFVGCGRDKTEEEILADDMSSWSWRSYRAVSEKLTPTIVAQYNKTNTDQVDAADVHAALSILWYIQGKSEYCYIEADILEGLQAEDMGDLSLGMKTIALYGMGHGQLSKSHYEKLKASHAAISGKTAAEIQLEDKLLLMSLTLVGICFDDPDIAKLGADGLGSISQLDYIGPLVGTIAEAKKGNILKARKELVELRKSERFNEHMQAMVTEVSAVIENSKDKERLAADIMERVTIVLAERVFNDIFAEENKQALLDRMRELPNMITGSQEPEEDADIETDQVTDQVGD